MNLIHKGKIYTVVQDEQIDYLSFQVHIAVSMNMVVVWDVEPCSLVEVYQHFRGVCCSHHQGDESSP
jgi:hypothetical protein